MTYTITYTKLGEYWCVEANDQHGSLVVTLEHIEGGDSRPYLICYRAAENFYPTYGEACSVFINILRQGR